MDCAILFILVSTFQFLALLHGFLRFFLLGSCYPEIMETSSILVSRFFFLQFQRIIKIYQNFLSARRVLPIKGRLKKIPIFEKELYFYRNKRRVPNNRGFQL